MMFKGSFLLIAAQYLILSSAQDDHQFSCEGGKAICVSTPSGCSPKDCQLIAAVERKDEKTFTFHLSGKGPKESYVAVGLSMDDKMGQDAVVGCFPTGVKTFINPAGHTQSQKTDWSAGSLGKSVSAVAGDRITCSFDLPSKIEAGPGISFDLNGGNKINLFVATGPGNNMNLEQHNGIPLRQEINPSSLTAKTGGPGKGNGSAHPSNASTASTGGFRAADLAVYLSVGVAASTVLFL